MTNIEVVTRKLALLDDHLRRLRERRPTELEAFARNPLLQDAVALSVLVVVQEATDIALHIASDEQWELPASYRESFVVLERHGVVDASLAASLGVASQLRNRIAHSYGSLDAHRLWHELPAGIAAFTAFSGAIAALLQRSER